MVAESAPLTTGNSCTRSPMMLTPFTRGVLSPQLIRLKRTVVVDVAAVPVSCAMLAVTVDWVCAGAGAAKNSTSAASSNPVADNPDVILPVNLPPLPVGLRARGRSHIQEEGLQGISLALQRVLDVGLLGG